MFPDPCQYRPRFEFPGSTGAGPRQSCPCIFKTYPSFSVASSKMAFQIHSNLHWALSIFCLEHFVLLHPLQPCAQYSPVLICKLLEEGNKLNQINLNSSKLPWMMTHIQLHILQEIELFMITLGFFYSLC